MIGVRELTTYCSGVPWIDLYLGLPSNTGVNAGPPVRGTVAVCGMELAITASFACGVPETDASTTPAGELAGMRRKSGGRSAPATKLQGPLSAAARYQRPD